MVEMIEKANGKRSVPQIFIKNTHVGGYDLYAIDRNGNLEKLYMIKYSLICDQDHNFKAWFRTQHVRAS